MPIRPFRPFLCLAALALGACASDAAPARDGPRATLFLSPAGQPFRGQPGQPYPVSAWFAQADADHDGKLTREEFRADFAAFFKQLDEDGNGAIDGVETQRYEQEIAPEVLPRLAQVRGGFPGERAERGTRRLAEAPRRRGQQYDGAPEFSLLNISEPVVGADVDFDGRITLQEFMGAADRRFDMLDADKRGYLTLGALPQTPEQIGVEGRRPR